jgi:hypothetical protein
MSAMFILNVPATRKLTNQYAAAGETYQPESRESGGRSESVQDRDSSQFAAAGFDRCNRYGAVARPASAFSSAALRRM